MPTTQPRTADGSVDPSAPTMAGDRPTGGRLKDAMRRFTKRMFPLMRPFAGRRWLGLFVVLHHRGRKSGRAYTTILASARTDAGLILPMTFGESAHWVHNVRAEGGAQIEWKGQLYDAGPPETLDYGEASQAFNPVLRFALRTAGIRTFVRVRLASAGVRIGPHSVAAGNPLRQPSPGGRSGSAGVDVAGSLTRNQRILVTVGVLLALLLAALDATIVGTALPRIVADLHGLDYFAWVVTAYLVAETAMTPIAGKLGDLFGRKPLLIGGMIGFVLASSLCGIAQNMGELIAFRAIQGIFGGTLIATVFASVADIYPPVARARMIGVLGGVFGLASVIGPTLGGFLTDNLSWRWVFYVNVPVGAIALLFVFLTMPRVRTAATWRRIDFPGAITLAGGLVPLLIALSITRDHAWTSPQVVVLLVVSAVVLAAFLLLERRAGDPIVPLALFRNRTFTVSVVTSFVAGIGLFGAVVFVPLIYQGVLGTSATDSGALLTPLVAGLIVASVVTGQLMTRVRYYRFVGTAGIAIMALGLWLLSQVTVRSDSSEVVRDLIVTGLGIGTTVPLYLSAAQSSVGADLTGVVTSQVTFWRNVGATLGIAILGSVLSQQLPDHIQSRLGAVQSAGPAAAELAATGGNAQALFDPARLASLPGVDVLAIRLALADTLHSIFLYAALAIAISAFASVFLKEVPLGAQLGNEPVEETEVDGTPALAA